MTGGYSLVSRRKHPELAARALLLFFGAAITLAFAGAAALALARYPPPPLPLILALAVGGLGMLALALARYDAAVALAFLLLGFVWVEPAPTDLAFAIVIAVGLVTGGVALRRVPPVAAGLVCGFIALNVLSATEAVEPSRAASFFAITLYLGVFSLWLTSYLRSARRARLVLRAYLASAVVSAVLSLLALWIALPGGDLLVTFGRAQGLFQDPNVFGPFLVPAALIVLEEILAPRLLRANPLTKLILFLVLTMGILFSFSRGAWLNFAVGVVVMLVILALRRGGSRKVSMLLVSLALAGAALTAAVTLSGSVEFLQERAGVQAYDIRRFGAQLAGLEPAERHPFGIGPGQFEATEAISAHSTYVRALAEQGVLGVLTLLGLLTLTLAWAARNAAVGRDTYGIGSAALLGAWCGLLANSIFVDTLHWRHLWLVAALIWAGAMRRPAPAGDAVPEHRA